MEVSGHDIVRARVRRQNSLEVDGADSDNTGRGSPSSFGPKPVSPDAQRVRPPNSLPPSRSALPSSRESVEFAEELVYGLPGLVSKKIIVRSRSNSGDARFQPKSAQTFSAEQTSSILGAVPVSAENA
ncbi:hypothetical protein AAVH_05234 [Aphelenchoides avenae]|nr:hypothetical protein AAVH_05234 [Aphelenchus avenae]